VLEVSDAMALRRALLDVRGGGESVGLVPTMGYLHRGHQRLAEAARAENDVVVMSIFVNPTQFGPSEDFSRYPRDLARDRRLAEECGVDILFVPDENTMYPDGVNHQIVWIDPGILGEHLDGASRPGHFRGVATIVAKLFNMVRPNRAYFGRKDGQQLIVVERMTRDLAFGIEIRAVETVREDDGLALSSRNVYLTPEDRRQAIVLASALALAREEIAAGERDAQRLQESMQRLVERTSPSARVDYIAIADRETVQPISGIIDCDVVIALAVYFGTTRLIDNMTVQFVDGEPRFT
jgi:pantoate--beta-alanine ligase